MKQYTGQDVKDLRDRLGITQEELAHRMGVSFFTISRWERKEKTNPIKSKIAQMMLAQIDAQSDNPPPPAALALSLNAA
jgi:type I restriction enzyme M protein